MNTNCRLSIKPSGLRPHCFPHGFVLMQLMVVIAIVGIIAFVAIPIYHDHNQYNVINNVVDNVVERRHAVLASADREIAKLDWQEMAYSAPEHMEIGSTSVVTVKLGGNKTFAELVSLLEEAGQKGGQKVEVSDLMVAHLTGSGFEITPITPEETQLVSSTRVTTWQWQVKARDYGIQKLYLSLAPKLIVDGKEAVISGKTFVRIISVQVTSAAGGWAFMERYREYIALLLTAIIIPLIVFYWRRLTKASNQSPDHPE